jgi:hypothetical protein
MWIEEYPVSSQVDGGYPVCVLGRVPQIRQLLLQLPLVTKFFVHGFLYNQIIKLLGLCL